MGSFVALLFVKGLSPEDFRSWGWRVPFLLGIVIGLVGLYIRSECDESPAYLDAKREGRLSNKPVRTAADLKGMKLRAPTRTTNKFMALLGGWLDGQGGERRTNQ